MLGILIPMGIFVIVMSIITIHKLCAQEERITMLEGKIPIEDTPSYAAQEFHRQCMEDHLKHIVRQAVYEKTNDLRKEFNLDKHHVQSFTINSDIHRLRLSLNELEKKLEAHKNGLKYHVIKNEVSHYFNRIDGDIVYYNKNITKPFNPEEFKERGFVTAKNLDLLEEKD